LGAAAYVVFRRKATGCPVSEESPVYAEIFVSLPEKTKLTSTSRTGFSMTLENSSACVKTAFADGVPVSIRISLSVELNHFWCASACPSG
jgi:hypothetical protein